MMNNYKTKLRDWWRGYSDEDVETAREIMLADHKPNEVLKVTYGQHRAIIEENMWEDVYNKQLRDSLDKVNLVKNDNYRVVE